MNPSILLDLSILIGFTVGGGGEEWTGWSVLALQSMIHARRAELL